MTTAMASFNHHTMNHVQLPSSRYSLKVHDLDMHSSHSSFPNERILSSSSVPSASAAAASDLDSMKKIGDPFRSQYSVMIGRTKACRDSVGNKRLDVLASMILPQYEKAATRVEKSMIVTALVDKVLEAGGSFVKVTADGDWRPANNIDAREKVGCVLRNLLSDKYRSSCKNKVEARRRRSSSSTTSTSTTQQGKPSIDQVLSSSLSTSATNSNNNGEGSLLDSGSTATTTPDDVTSDSMSASRRPEPIVSCTIDDADDIYTTECL